MFSRSSGLILALDERVELGELRLNVGRYLEVHASSGAAPRCADGRE
jgi:hypothetical protein